MKPERISQRQLVNQAVESMRTHPERWTTNRYAATFHPENRNDDEISIKTGAGPVFVDMPGCVLGPFLKLRLWRGVQELRRRKTAAKLRVTQ